MKCRDRLQVMMISIILMCVYLGDMSAGVTTIINDKAAKMMIYNKPDKTFIIMRKSEKRRFGNQYQLPHFAIYVQQPNKPLFSRVYTCRQIESGHNGSIKLKFSDIENGSGDAGLFSIIKHQPHSSMAQEFPWMHKTCQWCDQE